MSPRSIPSQPTNTAEGPYRNDASLGRSGLIIPA